MLLVEDRIKTQVSQVVTSLTNKRFNVVTVKKIGYYAYEYRKKQYDQGKQNQNQLTNTIISLSAMLMACSSPIECNAIQESTHDIWYLDSRCNNHMTGNLNLFSILDNSVQTDVTLGNNVQVTVFGKRYC